MTTKQYSRAFLLASAIFFSVSHASASGFAAGTQLSPDEMGKLEGATAVRLKGQTFRLLRGSAVAKSTGSAAGTPSTVVNERGIVGISHNEVLISQVPTQIVRQTLGRLSHAAVQVQYYDHMDISTLKFATFQEAVIASDQLKGLLPPEAGLDVPIRYGERRLR